MNLPSKDLGSFSLQYSINKQQNDVAIDSFRCPDGALQLQNLDATSDEGDFKGIVSEPKTEDRRALTGNIPDPKIRKSSQMGLNQRFAPLKSEGNHAIFDCTIPTQYSCIEVPKRKLTEEQQSLVQLEDSLSHLPLQGTQPGQHHIHVDQSQSIASINSNLSVTEEEVAACLKTIPLYVDYKNDDYLSSVSSIGSAVDTIPIQSKSLMVNDQSSEPIFASNLGLKTQGFNLGCISDLEFYPRNLLLGGEAALAPLEEDLHFFLLQGECYNMNFDLQNIDMSEYYDPGLIAEVPTHLYDSADYSVV